jgi:transposase InsO family protein
MPEELQKAEELWTKKSQRESFPEEVKLLTGGSELRATHKLYPLSPTLDKTGVLRVQGRIDGAEGVDSRVKAPIILDPKHPYTVLLVKKYHEEAAHQGLERILNELRQHYWVIHGRQAVRRAAHNCQVCKLRRATPKAPRMGDLPDCRLEHHQRPFTRTGVDYFGPMEVTVGRRREKRYGALFTCLVTRAVHLEIAHSLSTDSFIMALRRFTGRRGFPKEIWSDNGKNFVGADRELKQALAEFDQAKLQAECSSRGIKWNFIPPRTPHMGGSWERMVKSVKQALKATLKERAPREEVLMTLFVEAEALINSHPLTHVSLDHRDDEALTPNHFLIGTSSAAPVPGAFDDDDLDLRRHWRIAQRLTDLFWKRWLKEYLPTLIRRTKWYQSREPIRVNDLVIIVDNDTPRDVWIRGIVTTVYPGRNGVVRSVEVTTNRGTYHRAVVNLIVLDVKKGSDAASKPGGSVASSTIGSEP